MSQSLTYFVPFFQEGESRRCKIAIAETFPDILNGKRTGMHHIVSIETIITQLIYHDFIRREIVAEIHLTTNLVNCDEQIRLTELVAMQAVFEVTYRTDSKETLQIRTYSFQLL